MKRLHLLMTALLATSLVACHPQDNNVVDPEPPIVSMTAIPATLPAAGGATTLAMTAVTSNTLVSVVVTDQDGKQVFKTQKGIDSYQLALPTNTSAVDSVYTFKARATDRAGYVAEATTTVTVAGAKPLATAR